MMRDVAGSYRGSDVSPAALRLHASALLASFGAGNGGMVRTAYLEAYEQDCSAAVDELVRAGVWQAVTGGYRVVPAEAARMASEVDRLMEEAREQLRRGP